MMCLFNVLIWGCCVAVSKRRGTIRGVVSCEYCKDIGEEHFKSQVIYNFLAIIFLYFLLNIQRSRFLKTRDRLLFLFYLFYSMESGPFLPTAFKLKR